MYDPATPVWYTVILGPMPVDALAKLGIAVEEGEVVFFHHAMKHTFEAVPERRAICWPLLGAAVTTPTHIGQQDKYVGIGFDLIYAQAGGPIVLVSALLKPTKRFPAKYPVTSTYPLDRNSLDRRIRIGTTIVL